MKVKINNIKTLSISLITLIALSLFSCDTDKMKETPIENFIGTWKVEGRSMFKGIKIKIEKTDAGGLKGKVIELNDNKYVKMFSELNDIWVSKIKRSSNFEFKLTEKKIGSALFSLYGQSTSKEFKAQFIDKNTIGLTAGNSDPITSSIIYKRIVETFNANKQIFIDRSLPVLKQIDINYGQPDNPQDFEVFLPGMYISWSIVEPAAKEPNVLQLDFHVLQEPGAHTENYSARLEKGVEYILMLKTIKYILNKLRASNTTGLKYAGERQNITPFFRYHILTYSCFIDEIEDSLTKGSYEEIELEEINVTHQIKQKEEAQTPGDIDTYK